MRIKQTVFVKATKGQNTDCVKNAIGCIMIKGWGGDWEQSDTAALDIAGRIMGEADFAGGDVVAVEEYRNGVCVESFLFDRPTHVRGIKRRSRRIL